MVNNIQQFALQLIEQNKNMFQGNEYAQSLIDIIKNNDFQRGIEAANNFLKSNGIDQQTGVNQARKFFGL